MTNEEAIEWLEAIRKKYIHGGDEGFDEKRNEAIDLAISALSRDRWISVEERLPENAKWVLRYSAITEATWLAFFNSTGAWMDEQGEAHYITHWMPLPEPPKDE